MPAVDHSSRVGTYAGLQATAEIGIGSVIHALGIPLGGHLLSLNQGFLLTLALRGLRGRRLEGSWVVLGISGVTAALKPLSPAGNRLGPMLAIGVQGLLFASGVFFLGANALGAAVGLGLLSLWGFAQPLLLGYALFGRALFQAIESLWREAATWMGVAPERGWQVLVGLVSVKVLTAICVAWIAWWANARMEKMYRGQVSRIIPRSTKQQRSSPMSTPPPSWLALRDLSNPLYVASLLLTLGFLRVVRHINWGELVFFGLRAAVLGWAIFYCVRRVPLWLQTPGPKRWIKKLPGIARAFDAAVQEIRR